MSNSDTIVSGPIRPLNSETIVFGKVPPLQPPSKQQQQQQQPQPLSTNPKGRQSTATLLLQFIHIIHHSLFCLLWRIIRALLLLLLWFTISIPIFNGVLYFTTQWGTISNWDLSPIDNNNIQWIPFKPTNETFTLSTFLLQGLNAIYTAPFTSLTSPAATTFIVVLVACHCVSLTAIYVLYKRFRFGMYFLFFTLCHFRFCLCSFIFLFDILA